MESQVLRFVAAPLEFALKKGVIHVSIGGVDTSCMSENDFRQTVFAGMALIKKLDRDRLACVPPTPIGAACKSRRRAN
jgi:hypothetical protein